MDTFTLAADMLGFTEGKKIWAIQKKELGQRRLYQLSLGGFQDTE